MKPFEPDSNDYFAHFPDNLSPQIKQYALNDAFRHSRYIFTGRRGKQQYGYCTHCSSEFKTSRLTHNMKTLCPECTSKCTVKASGLGRKKMVDEVYFVYYEKSVKDPKVIIARGILAVRDYSKDYYNVETQYLERARYVFEMGKSVMFERFGYYSMAKTMEHGKFTKRKSVYSLFGQYVSNKMVLSYSPESIKEAVRETSFSWSGWDSYNYNFSDMIDFFYLYSRYPCIEYLTKLGFKDLVNEKLMKGNTYSSINWRGKTLFKVLKLTKQELNEIKFQDIQVNFWFLNLLKMNREKGWKLSLSELSKMADVYDGDHFIQRLQKMLKYGSLRDILNYLSKQYARSSEDFYSEASVLGTWEDYHQECVKLEMDLTKTDIVFPGKLSEAHQNNIKKIKYKADQLMNQKIKERVKNLKKYSFEYGGLLIKPVESTEQMIKEGNALGHCVGGYCDRYAKGSTDIFVIRKVEEPNAPYFTIEIKDNKVIQCRGKQNCPPDEKVKAFIKKYKAQKLSTKKARINAKISVPA